ncbi:hypothetical protein N7509_009311 [Penicillium cosmopolitanum]|uniref:Uncharacterized protein n=1 Tax=Penicillium cosmopolitanum TaxID=1131564 RepID=A0A9W9VPC7_9EURO|nr:uncharacterized protein N7509_009311 [Penicillium cosmopolitanum]KAJ5386770.1 hypothetical protein N7509_009311 [Penicillium cosmopolitanum]
MPDEPRRIVIEKSSTVRRRYQRSNKQFRFTAAELKRIEREEELDRRAKNIREKEKKRVANKKKKDEQERERKRLGLPDPNARKVSSSQPLLSNFLGLARQPPPIPEPQLAHDTTGSGVDSVAGDTEEDSDGPDDLDEELENELSCLQEALVPENFDDRDAVIQKDDPDAESENDPPLLQEVTVPTEGDEHGARDERSGNGVLCLEKAVFPDEVDGLDANLESDQADGDTDPFDDLDEELERELYCLQDAGILEENKHDKITNDTSHETLALCYDRDDDEFSDCSAFDDADILKAAEAVIESPSIQPGPRDHLPSKPAIIVHPSSNDRPNPVMNTIPTANDSFRDDTADYMEEVFERGAGDSFCEIYE